MTPTVVSGVPLKERKRALSPRGLRIDARPLHRPPLVVFNAGWLCVFAALLLSLVGIAAIETTEADHASRQAVHLGIAIVAATIVALPHYRRIRRWSYPLMALALVLLVFVLIPWVPESLVRPRNGSRRWINLGVTDFQPSELAKVAYILALANYLRFRDNYRRLPGLISLLLLTFIPLALVLKEPDLGTSLLFLPTLFAMVIAAGGRIRHFVLIVAIGAACIPALYPLLKPYQQQRVKAMVAQLTGDTRYVQDIGYQGDRAITLIGAGGLTGAGRERAQSLVMHNHLPEEHNDMIFAVVCCRWGFLGGAVLWGAYLLLTAGGLLVSAACKDPFGRLVAVGLTAIIFAQMVINTGMNIGVLPITGMTLPFVSYGGSSLVITWMMIGLILNIGLRRAHHLWRDSFEFDDAERTA